MFSLNVFVFVVVFCVGSYVTHKFRFMECRVLLGSLERGPGRLDSPRRIASRLSPSRISDDARQAVINLSTPLALLIQFEWFMALQMSSMLFYTEEKHTHTHTKEQQEKKKIVQCRNFPLSSHRCLLLSLGLSSGCL